MEKKIELDFPAKDGVTKREHLELIWESTGQFPRALEEPSIPERFDKVWDVYWEIRNGESITYQELRSYIELSGDVLTPWEVEQIRFIDKIVCNELSKRSRPKKGEGSGGHKDPGD